MISSAYATAEYMLKIGFDKKVYVIGSKTLAMELEARGISTVGSGPDITEAALPAQVMQCLKQLDPEVGAVVVGFDEHFSFSKLFKAINYLRNESVRKFKFIKFSASSSCGNYFQNSLPLTTTKTLTSQSFDFQMQA